MKELDLLDDYLEGRLSEEEQVALEQNPVFMQALKEWQMVGQSLAATAGAEQLRQEAQSLFNQRRQQQRLRYWGLIIGFLMVLAGLYYWYTNHRTIRFFEQHYQPLHQAMVLRAPTGDLDNNALYKLVDEAYQQGDYQRALQRLERQTNTPSKSSYYYFRLAELQLLNQQAEEALSAAKKMNNENEAMRLWLQAWAHWQLGEVEQARMRWIILQQLEHPLNQQAAKVLQLIEE